MDVLGSIWYTDLLQMLTTHSYPDKIVPTKHTQHPTTHEYMVCYPLWLVDEGKCG